MPAINPNIPASPSRSRRSGEVVRLNVVHDQLKAGSEMAKGISDGWPLVLSGLKSFLETGKALDIMAIKRSCSAAAHANPSQAKVA